VADAKRRRRQDDGAGASDGSGRSGRLATAAQVAQRARRELAAITGLKPQGVTELEQYDDGTWKVTVELLELSRVPETDDIIGSYEVDLDENGELIGYRRLRRYARSQVLDEQGARGF
jgi:hypothetical protein